MPNPALRKTHYIVAAIAAALVLAAVIPQVRTALLAPFVFVNIADPEGEWRPLELVTREPTREARTVESPSGRTLALDVYVPAGGADERHAAMLLTAPLAGGGPTHGPLVNLAETFSESGFVVAIPWHEEARGILSRADEDDTVAAFRALRSHPGVAPDRVGLFAVSYSNGPVFLAAADERIREDVAFVASFAGYHELEDAARYVVTGEYQYEGERETLEPEQWVKGQLRDNLRAWGLTDADVDAFFAAPDRFDELLAGHPDLRADMRALSPARVAGDVEARVIIGHSTGDNTIPYVESLRLAGTFRGTTPVTLAIVDMFRHGDLLPLNAGTFFKNYLPSFGAGYRFMYAVLAERWR